MHAEYLEDKIQKSKYPIGSALPALSFEFLSRLQRQDRTLCGVKNVQNKCVENDKYRAVPFTGKWTVMIDGVRKENLNTLLTFNHHHLQSTNASESAKESTTSNLQRLGINGWLSTMARPRCPTCKSRKWVKDTSGRLTCDHGHILLVCAFSRLALIEESANKKLQSGIVKVELQDRVE